MKYTVISKKEKTNKYEKKKEVPNNLNLEEARLLANNSIDMCSLVVPTKLLEERIKVVNSLVADNNCDGLVSLKKYKTLYTLVHVLEEKLEKKT